MTLFRQGETCGVRDSYSEGRVYFDARSGCFLVRRTLLDRSAGVVGTHRRTLALWPTGTVADPGKAPGVLLDAKRVTAGDLIGGAIMFSRRARSLPPNPTCDASRYRSVALLQDVKRMADGGS